MTTEEIEAVTRREKKRREQPTACVAKELRQGLGFRCREMAAKNARCEEHQDAGKFPAHDRPTVVFVKCNVPENRMPPALLALCQGEFESATRSTAAKAVEFQAIAEVRGMDAFRYRADVTDSGTEVWGGGGAINAATDPATFLEEIDALIPMFSTRIWKKPPDKRGRISYVVQIKFSAEGGHGETPPAYTDHSQEFHQLLQLTWNNTHVYCNPSGPTGCVHTVNFGGLSAEPVAPRGYLRFKGGDWGTDSIPHAQE